MHDMNVVEHALPVDAPVHIHIDDGEAVTTSVPPSVPTHRNPVFRVDTPASLASVMSSRDSKSSVISPLMAPLNEELEMPNDLEAPVLPSFEGAGLSEVSLGETGGLEAVATGNKHFDPTCEGTNQSLNNHQLNRFLSFWAISTTSFLVI